MRSYSFALPNLRNAADEKKCGMQASRAADTRKTEFPEVYIVIVSACDIAQSPSRTGTQQNASTRASCSHFGDQNIQGAQNQSQTGKFAKMVKNRTNKMLVMKKAHAPGSAPKNRRYCGKPLTVQTSKPQGRQGLTPQRYARSVRLADSRCRKRPCCGRTNRCQSGRSR